ncbi:NAD-dependent epimerase/dehydratase family protein [Halomicrobium katesii]|uniref:NAD-dependent epimerase/dehydratase family protein n=1 Tax=Halomicrobium katesii TaxID=437163 RepID=UPI0005D2CD2C|nr:NAD-dependent epimerase/dehydratase family protein [Halomicrobium katesii]
MSETERQNQPHAVVTGGSGFVGSHLVERLLDDGFRVTTLDNYSSGRQENLKHIDDPSLEQVTHDVRDPFPDFDAVDQLYHFASRASPTDFEDYSIQIAMTNSLGARNAFEWALEYDATVVLASTSEVYGNPKTHPQTESYNGNVNIRGIRAPYDEGKRFSEALARAYIEQTDIDIRTVRIFNTYGPQMRPSDGRVIPTFLDQALSGKDLTIHGDGQQTRTFCYVSDLVEGVRRIAETDAMAGDVLNLGHTNEITIEELGETVVDIVDSSSTLTYESRPKDDPDLRQPDISKAKEILDWEPTVDLGTGIRKTVEHFADQRDGDEQTAQVTDN